MWYGLKEIVHRVGSPFLDNHYRGYQYLILFWHSSLLILAQGQTAVTLFLAAASEEGLSIHNYLSDREAINFMDVV